MNKREIIERLKNIARHAVHNVGEKPFVMSLDDGIAVHEAIELLEKPETNCSEIPNNWIPCSERLPENDDDVIVQMNDGSMMVDCRAASSNGWFWAELGDEPVAWMPLPEPYQE